MVISLSNSHSLRHLLSSVLLIGLTVILLSSCASDKRPAPVRNLSIEPEAKNIWKSGRYRVSKNDTLYSISFRFGIDFQQLAAINQIEKPYTIYPGQEIKLRHGRMNKSRAHSKVSKKTPPTKNKNVAKQQNKNEAKQGTKKKTKGLEAKSKFDTKKKVTAWRWPVKNKHWKKKSFGKDTRQAIQISGRLGDAITAAADGRVVYSGNGLVGYGNLLIIKHSQSFLSAYAHNEKLLVKENDKVKAGQKIATMGKNDTGQIELHFEIRYQGRPVNPLKYLPPFK